MRPPPPPLNLADKNSISSLIDMLVFSLVISASTAFYSFLIAIQQMAAPGTPNYMPSRHDASVRSQPKPKKKKQVHFSVPMIDRCSNRISVRSLTVSPTGHQHHLPSSLLELSISSSLQISLQLCMPPFKIATRPSISGSQHITSVMAMDWKHGSTRQSMLSGAGSMSYYTRFQATSGGCYLFPAR